MGKINVWLEVVVMVNLLCIFSRGIYAEVTETITLVENGKPLVMVVVPADVNSSLESLAHTLSKYILLSTKAEIPVQKEPADIGLIKIHLGNTSYVKNLNLGIEKLDADGFVISFPDDKNIVIIGGSEFGTEFGVYEFLERYIGIRWLFPGELGEYIPCYETLKISTKEVQQEPIFFSRFFSGLKGKEQADWARYNRMHHRVRFHHNLLRLFPPETYTKIHPQFFPIKEKETRYLPKDNKTHGWQPCFSSEGIVEEAIKNICEYFTKNPERTSYSLGVNDEGGHCKCGECLARVGDKKNSLGLRNYSDIYYEWCNAVVEGVLKKYPDKYFGLLAYSEVFDPPSKVKLNSHIIPYMTYERLKWADKEIEKEGQKLTGEWAKFASTLGWYDYIYGKPRDHYITPRVWFHKMAEYYRFAYENNVRALYAEAYPAADWREGPKLYLSLKLQWNPNLDVDKTLKEWYECAVGKEAAPYLAEYFAFWEEYWTKRIPQSEWFKSGRKNQYLDFNSSNYLVPLRIDDMVKCEQLLKLVVEKAGTEKEKSRANFFLSSFEGWRKNLSSFLNKFEQLTELEKISQLKDEVLLFAVNNYKNWVEKLPPNSFTDSIYLKIGLLMEKAGKKGAWAQAFDNSPWAKSNIRWLKSFVYNIHPAIINSDSLSAEFTSIPPKIDGILDDKCWLKAKKVDDFREYQSDILVSQPTLVGVAYDSDNLYLAYLCMEKNMGDLVTEIQEHDGRVWRDDCIEFFVVPSSNGDKFYQIIVSASEIKYDAYITNTGWNPQYSAKVYKGDLFWTVEMAIPFVSFAEKKPNSGSRWKVNFTRQRQSGKEKNKEISGWRFTAGNNLSPDKFGFLLFR